MVGAPTSKSDGWGDGVGIANGVNGSSRRLTQSLLEQDVRSEKAIACAQGGLAVFILLLNTFGLRNGLPDLNGWLALALGALVATSAARWYLVRSGRLPERRLDILTMIDVVIVLAAIWSYQFVFDHPASGILKAPTFVMLLVLIGVRALRFHPRPIAVAGASAVVGWSALVLGVVMADGVPSVTGDYRYHLTSFEVLPAAEVERIVALAALTFVLALGACAARGLLGRSAHMTDYGEALESARHHLRESVQAREEAEAAFDALATRDVEISEQNRMFTTALDNMSQGLCMFDSEQKLLVCNHRYLEIYDLPKRLARRGTSFRDIIESRIKAGNFPGGNADTYLVERLSSVREPVRNTQLHELRDGRIIAITHQPMEGGGWLATHDDVTQLRRIEAKLSYMARHDALTDLPNRTQPKERLEQLLPVVDGRNLVVAVVEVDRFKEINETLGPSVGDVLLQSVAQRLLRRMEASEIVARIGADEFVILQCVDDPNEVDNIATQAQSVLGTSFDIEGHSLTITVSAGVAVAPSDGETADDLLKRAELALGRAKEDGLGNIRFFEHELDGRMRARHKLEQDMRIALREGQFELYYQPQINLADGSIAGFEALLRWQHPERGFISPSEFIAVAEDCGLIVQLGDWALRRACEEAASWVQPKRVAVNLSVAQFRSGCVRQSVISALGASGLSPNRLELEITESVLMQEGTEVPAVLGKLQDIGIDIALDDFGTGYSSLSYLTRMRFDKIKIDKHFISGAGQELDSALAILRSVVALSQSLQIKTVVEGVETAEQLAMVKSEGCTEAQGFYVGRPMPAQQVAALLAKERPGRKMVS